MFVGLPHELQTLFAVVVATVDDVLHSPPPPSAACGVLTPSAAPAACDVSILPSMAACGVLLPSDESLVDDDSDIADGDRRSSVSSLRLGMSGWPGNVVIGAGVVAHSAPSPCAKFESKTRVGLPLPITTGDV